jgi:hypothetical protein
MAEAGEQSVCSKLRSGSGGTAFTISAKDPPVGGGATGGHPLNPEAQAFDMDAMAAAAAAAACAASSRNARLPDFSLDKPEVWFSMVEACFEDCNINNEKQHYNKVLYSRGSRFLNYNFLQCAVDGKNNSKTKVQKVFFFIFMSSYAEMSF